MDSNLQSLSSFIEKSTKLPEGIQFIRSEFTKTIVFKSPYDDDDDVYLFITLEGIYEGNPINQGISFNKFRSAASIINLVQETANEFSRKIGNQ